MMDQCERYVASAACFAAKLSTWPLRVTTAWDAVTPMWAINTRLPAELRDDGFMKDFIVKHQSLRGASQKPASTKSDTSSLAKSPWTRKSSSGRANSSVSISRRIANSRVDGFQCVRPASEYTQAGGGGQVLANIRSADPSLPCHEPACSRHANSDPELFRSHESDMEVRDVVHRAPRSRLLLLPSRKPLSTRTPTAGFRTGLLAVARADATIAS